MKALLLTIAACMVLSLAGCGGDDPATEATQPPATTTADARTDVGGSTASPDAADSGSATGGGEQEEFKRATVTIEVPVRPAPDIEPPNGPPPKELIVKDLRVGSGPPVKAGDEVTVNYQGADMSGKVRYSSWRRGKPFAFKLGRNAYTHEFAYGQGFEEGIEGMRVGGRRELSVPADMISTEIPVIYVVDLLGK